MKIIYDKNKITQIIPKHIFSYEYPFLIIEYEAGETMIDPSIETQYLQLVVEGIVSIEYIYEDGNLYTVSADETFTLLGDIEIIDESNPVFFALAKTNCTVLAIDIKQNRETLMNDLTFCHFIMHSLIDKMKKMSSSLVIPSLKERLIEHIKYHNNVLKDIDKTANTLHCSRRHLQRLIKQLVDENLLIKKGKGVYIYTP